MEKSRIPAVLLSDSLGSADLLRKFKWGEVFTGEDAGKFFIIVHERGSLDQTVYEYESDKEFREDVRRVVSFPSADGGVGVPAAILPDLPTRSAGCEEPIPDLPVLE